MTSALGWTVRRLTSEDALAYNAFFAAGTEAHPDRLRIAPEDFAVHPFSTDTSGESVTLGAIAEGGSLVGVGTFQRDQGRIKRRHIGWVVRMYVHESASGRGVGRGLLRALIDEARTYAGIEKLNLTVAAHNAGAIRLYESEGFVTFAREEDAFRDAPGSARAELSMARRL